MRTRFAPSPTGPLHLGHAFAAMVAHDLARTAGGEFLLRIEDLDQGRARPEWERAICDDLEWLGLRWDGPVIRQSDRAPAYRAALADLWRRDLLYPCGCSRADIAAALSAPQEGAGPAQGPDGPVYPRTCHGRDWSEFSFAARSGFPLPEAHALRLDMALAGQVAAAARGRALGFAEEGRGPKGEHGWIDAECGTLGRTIGDVVLARRGMAAAYHLAVAVDDAAQGITHVSRGADLFEATRIHVVLQALLGLPTPVYHHHRLIRDSEGKRLAKRDDARALGKYRSEGATPADIRRLVGLG
ncbi:MAG: tRNA glutamyl-Q(34) synthetase GluQRS [Proteobacteria bacterium]|nr:tRNA glutamyl-Q(34) synthetase GluQRS [Pseudomonadota bacterium]MBS0573642.1 tRNA glutamyl-Q(34) synthetase GluQRS [Pseudomonadota bacterium]